MRSSFAARRSHVGACAQVRNVVCATFYKPEISFHISWSRRQQRFLNCHAQFFAAPQQSALFNNAEFSASVASAKAVMEEYAWISPSSSMCLRYALLSCSSARSYWGPFEFRKRDPEEGMRGLPKTVELDT
jgi:hypothetical protein